jgi:hypothetical protein
VQLPPPLAAAPQLLPAPPSPRSVHFWQLRARTRPGQPALVRHAHHPQRQLPARHPPMPLPGPLSLRPLAPGPPPEHKINDWKREEFARAATHVSTLQLSPVMDWFLSNIFRFCLIRNCAPSTCWFSTVVSCGLACSICAPPCSTAVFTFCSSASLLHAFGVLLEFPVSVVSVLIRSFGFAFCPVAVFLMILCSSRPLKVVFVTCNELSHLEQCTISTKSSVASALVTAKCLLSLECPWPATQVNGCSTQTIDSGRTPLFEKHQVLREHK